MKGALQLVKVAGIPVRVHWTFGLLLLWVMFISVSNGLGISGTALMVAIVGIVFLCVVLHEYGHALTARRFGVQTRDIILSPIGGIARLEFIPDKPRQEILIALAGPAVNLVIAIVLMTTALFVVPEQVDFASRKFWGWSEPQSVIILIAKINLILLLFNLTPAFPMDGGRVLRAALSIPFSRLAATQFAGFLGQGIGLFLFSAGMFKLLFGRSVYIFGLEVSDIVLAFIGVFVFLAARREISSVKLKASLQSTRVRDIIGKTLPTLPAGQLVVNTTGEVPQESGILLMDDGELEGVLFTEYLQHARESDVTGSTLRHYASGLYEKLDSNQSLGVVLELFQKNGYRLCPVYDGQELIGVITRSDLAQFVNGKKLIN